MHLLLALDISLGQTQGGVWQGWSLSFCGDHSVPPWTCPQQWEGAPCFVGLSPPGPLPSACSQTLSRHQGNWPQETGSQAPRRTPGKDWESEGSHLEGSGKPALTWAHPLATFFWSSHSLPL